MTAPRTRRVNAGRGHYYLLDGERVPGVTTIIKNGLPKDLLKWSAEGAAWHAIDHWDRLSELPVSDRFKELSGAPFAKRKAAAARGTKVHHFADRIIQGEAVEVPEALAGYVDSCVRFLDEYKIEPVLTERPVFSRTHKYGGSFDVIGDIYGGPEPSLHGTRQMVDYKTAASGIWGETALQCCAYENAEIYVDENGDEQDMPAVDGSLAVWLRPDGYDVYPLNTGPDVFRYFLYVAQVAAGADTVRDLVGAPITTGA